MKSRMTSKIKKAEMEEILNHHVMRRTHSQYEAHAFHEAGHAVMCWHEGITITEATLFPAKDSGGHVLHRSVLHNSDVAKNDSDMRRLRYIALIRVALAGAIAQKHFRPKSHHHKGAKADRASARELALRVEPNGDCVFALLKLCDLQVKARLDMALVHEVAVALQKEVMLKGKEVTKIIRENILKRREITRRGMVTHNRREVDVVAINRAL